MARFLVRTAAGLLLIVIASPAHAVESASGLVGLTNFAKTIEGSGWGDTTARTQLGWTSGAWSNTFYLTSWFPTGRYELGFQPNTGRSI